LRNHNRNVRNTLTKCFPCIVFILVAKWVKTLSLNVYAYVLFLAGLRWDPILLLLLLSSSSSSSSSSFY
jgi:hypothetical protein